ncbi:hypothetical protein C6P44_000701 [Monosporozyma unispora]|nr:hypothetical protein C6P44_000701 [Kazachstania unispora]
MAFDNDTCISVDTRYPPGYPNQGNVTNGRGNNDVSANNAVHNTMINNNQNSSASSSNNNNSNVGTVDVGDGTMMNDSMGSMVVPSNQQVPIMENGMIGMVPPGFLPNNVPLNMNYREGSMSYRSWNPNVMPQQQNSVYMGNNVNNNNNSNNSNNMGMAISPPHQAPNSMPQGIPVYIPPTSNNTSTNLSQNIQMMPQLPLPQLVAQQVSPIDTGRNSTTDSVPSQRSHSPTISEVDNTALNNVHSYAPSNDTDVSSEYTASQNNNNINNMESSIDPNAYAPYKHPKRNTKACDMCRDKKIRCGPLDPITKRCNNCKKRDKECTFNFHVDLEKKRQFISLQRKRNKINKPTTKNEKSSSIDITQIDQSLTDNMKGVSTDFVLDEKTKILVDKLLRKINLLDDVQVNSTELIEDLNIRDGISNLDDQFIPKCKYKQYRTALLTPNKLKWINDKLNMCRKEKIESTEFYKPIKQHFNEISKWYMIYAKKLTNFEIFLEKDDYGNFKLFDLPKDIEQTNRILENLHTSLLYTTTAIVTSCETKKLVQKYYNQEPMDFSEKFLLNTCLIYGIQASFTLYSNEGIHVRKDKHMLTPDQMKEMDHKLFINCAYFYGKMMTHSSNLFTLKALLLWSKYVLIILGNELSADIFAKAVYIMQSLGLHKESYYENLSKKDFILTRGLWWYCVSTDRLNSVRLSIPPLIASQNNCPVYLSEDIFVKDLNILLAYDDKYEDQVTNFKDALNYAVSHHNHLRMAITYYGSQLVKIEADMVATCFDSSNILSLPFEKLLNKALGLDHKLKKWRESLHPVMRLETFRDYYKILSVQNTEQKPEFQFEVICSRVILYQFRFLSLGITLNLFIISLIDDNMERMTGNPVKIEILKQIKAAAITQYTECSRKILKTFATLKHQPFMYRECVHFFYTAILSLMFKVIDGLDNEKLQLENLFLLEILHKPYSIILERDQNTRICENMKWNAGYFIYTYLLKNVVSCLARKNIYLGTFTFGLNVYDATLRLMTKIAGQKKDTQVALLERTDSNTKKLTQKSCKIFDDLTNSFIDFLKDKNFPTVETIRKYVFNNNPTWQPELKTVVPRDCSLFTPQGTKTETTEEEVLREFNDNIGFFTNGSFLYDRDLILRTSIKDWNML